MDIRYSDEDVRGERSNHPDKSNRSDKEIELFFTENAKKKYDILTGSQKTFVDRELDDLKLSRDSSESRKTNLELEQTITFEKKNNQIVVTDIVYNDYRNSQQYRKAQIRMNNMNH